MDYIMDLEDLQITHSKAEQQVQLLEVHITELCQRRDQAKTQNSTQEFDYLNFKLSIMRGVKNMYQEYRDQKWVELQTESRHALLEVLNSPANHQQATPLTPPLSPLGHTPSTLNHSPSSPSDQSALGRLMSEDLHLHMIPAPLTPIMDVYDLMLTPPDSPTGSPTHDRHYFSRNLGSALFEGSSRHF